MALNWKKVLTSKTLWVNFLAGLMPLVATQLETYREFMTPLNFAIYTSTVAIVNFVVRFLTTQPMFVENKDGNTSSNT